VTRRRPAAPGVRPPRAERIAHRVCVVDGVPFTLDRDRQPWSRARTCSPRCARILGNRSRTPATCRHCEMVEDFRLAQDTDVRRIDVACRDEDARPVTFRQWLTFYEWTTWEEPAA
jgi:hypothetical protein